MNLRTQAEQNLKTLLQPENLPTVKNENYRYTSLRNLKIDRHPQEIEALSAVPVQLLESAVENSLFILLRAGKAGFNVIHMSEELASLGVKMTAPEGASSEAATSAFHNDVFAQLVEARALNELQLTIPKGVRPRKPIQLLHYFSPESDCYFSRVHIEIGTGAEVSIVEEFVGAGRTNGHAPLASTLTSMTAQAGARVHYYPIQNWGRAVDGFIRQSILAEQDAEVRVGAFSLGGAKIQTRCDVECTGRGARIEVYGAARGDENQHFDFWITARHNVSDTSSSTQYLTVMADQARAVFNGNIVITDKGLRTDASQHNKNMLLSPRAVVDSYPKLEISTDDVKCAHGSAISPISLDQMIYLQSRGISAEEAEMMIVNGFTNPVVRLLPTDSLKLRIQTELEKKHGARTDSKV